MSKVYSNKALPPGTVLREWRLEQVLGVGGFGIVYKGRGQPDQAGQGHSGQAARA